MGQGKGETGRLGQGQCAHCQQKGHWKRNCHHLRAKNSSQTLLMNTETAWRRLETSSPAEPLGSPSRAGKKRGRIFSQYWSILFCAQYTRVSLFSQERVTVIGATGVAENHSFFKPIKSKLGKHWVTHQFLYLPNSSRALLGSKCQSKLSSGRYVEGVSLQSPVGFSSLGFSAYFLHLLDFAVPRCLQEICTWSSCAMETLFVSWHSAPAPACFWHVEKGHWS